MYVMLAGSWWAPRVSSVWTTAHGACPRLHVNVWSETIHVIVGVCSVQTISSVLLSLVSVAKGCDGPEQLLHGKVQERSLTTGRAVEFHCDKGYTLIGDPLVVCIGGITWSSTFPTCQRKKPHRNPNTQLDGSKHVCRSKVIASFLLLAAKLCPPPPGWREDSSRTGSPQDFHVGQSVRVTCPKGHQVKGSGTITCRPDQTWSLINSVCESRSQNRFHCCT